MFHYRFNLLILSFSASLIGCAPPPFAKLSPESDLAGSATEEQALTRRIDAVLETAKDARLLSTDRNAAWQIMHAVICYGPELKIDTPDRGIVSALDYAFTEGLINGFELMPGAQLPSGKKGLKARLEPGSYEGQGHVDQWIAILAMADVPAKTQITVKGEAFSVEDLARQAQFDAPYNMLDEFSWTLIALCHYFPDESSWTAAEELELTWETLVEQELLQDIDYSPCGGTHRLAGLVAALNAKSRLELPDSETWKQAAEKVHNHFAKVKASRGADGRLTSLYFTGSGKVADLAGELASTGHLFEFVALAADDQQIQEDWIALAASHLCGLIEQTEHLDLDCGALYHALHGLKIYRSRIKS